MLDDAAREGRYTRSKERGEGNKKAGQNWKLHRQTAFMVIRRVIGGGTDNFQPIPEREGHAMRARHAHAHFVERPSFQVANTDPHFAPFYNHPTPPARACVRSLCKKFKKTFSYNRYWQSVRVPITKYEGLLLSYNCFFFFFEKRTILRIRIYLFLPVALGVGKNLEEMDCVR